MTKKSKRPFYSFSDRIEKGTQEDYFYNPEDFNWSKDLEEKFPVIKKEILTYLQKDSTNVKPYYATEMMNLPGRWKTLGFYFWGMQVSKDAIRDCPETVKTFLSIPGISSFSVSILDPQSEIKGHRGDTDAIYRCHLGLIVPGALPECGFYVGYEERPWEEGKLLIFNDSAYHKGWNHTNEVRILVLFDVFRDEYANKKRWICSRIWGGLIFSMLNQKFPLVKKPDSIFRKIYSYLFCLPVYLVFLFGIRKNLFNQKNITK